MRTYIRNTYIKILCTARCVLKSSRFISVDLMERARPHSPEVTVYGSPARVHGFSRIMRGYIYGIDYGNGGKQRDIFAPIWWNWYRHSTDITSGTKRNDTKCRAIKIRSHASVTARYFNISDSCAKINFLRTNQTVLRREYKGFLMLFTN